MNICALVVTHNRPGDLLRCLDGLARQTRSVDAVLVVDNASGPATALALETRAGFQVLRLPTNLGGAGGFAAGLRWSTAHGYDWTWMMDDDAIPQPTALAELVPSMEHHDGELVALASCVVPDSGVAPPKLSAGGEIEIDRAMFVGFAAPKRVVDEIGFPREDFFIYTDDTDYCWRIQRAGGRVLRVHASVVLHMDWASTGGNVELTLFGRRRLLYPRVAGWKKYYLARNRLLAARPHSARRFVVALAQSVTFAVLTMVLAPADTGVVWSGLVDGLRGRAGARVVPK